MITGLSNWIHWVIFSGRTLLAELIMIFVMTLLKLPMEAIFFLAHHYLVFLGTKPKQIWVIMIIGLLNLMPRGQLNGKIQLGEVFLITRIGGYIVSGHSASGISSDKTEANLGSYDYWVIKINSSGSIIWQNTIGGMDLDYRPNIIQTEDGGYLVGGISNSGISGDKTEASFGYTDIWILKLDLDGNILWQKSLGGSLYDNLYYTSF